MRRSIPPHRELRAGHGRAPARPRPDMAEQPRLGGAAAPAGFAASKRSFRHRLSGRGSLPQSRRSTVKSRACRSAPCRRARLSAAISCSAGMWTRTAAIASNGAARGGQAWRILWHGQAAPFNRTGWFVDAGGHVFRTAMYLLVGRPDGGLAARMGGSAHVHELSH